MLQIVLGVIILFVPLFAGSVFKEKSVLYTYLLGQILLWACFQVIAVPLIHIRAPFHTLAIAYIGCMIALSAFGLKARWGTRFQREKLNIFFVAACIIVLYQMGIYIFGQHLDEDDARWIAEANDALGKNRMLLYNPSTGEYIGRFIGEMQKDVYSPWSMYVATISFCTGISPALIAHTVYAPVLLFLSYCAYKEIGSLLFQERAEQGIFLLSVSIINMFFAGNTYTQSVFALTRIWQGKAVVAAVMIPSILMLFLQLRSVPNGKNWFVLGISGIACCLFSGMGIAIGLIMISLLGAYILFCNKFAGFQYYMLVIISPLVYGFCYLLLKG